MILVLGLWSTVTVSMHAGVCFAQGSVTVQNASGGFVGSYTTIQEGIDACPVGGTVSVSAGTYNEAVCINKKIASIGIGTPTINPPSGNGVTFDGNGADNALISGFKITGGNHGIYCKHDADPTITNNTFTNNSGYAIYMEANSFPILSGNTALNNTYNGIGVSGNITSSGTWCYNSLPYIIAGNVTITKDKALIIEPNTVIKFIVGNYSLRVYGTLIADGTPDKKIVFTSIKDDTYLGDTNNDGATTLPAKGDWRYIQFIDPSSNNSIMDNH